MSLYMSKSLTNQIDMTSFDEKNILKLSLKDEIFKIIKLQNKNNCVIVKIKVTAQKAEEIFKKTIKNTEIGMNWYSKKIISYDIISLKHVLENDIDNYIMKLNLSYKES